MSFIDDNYDYSDQSGYESNLEVSQENLQDEITESEVREMVVSQPREMVMTPPREMIETPPVLTPSPYEVINAETPKFCCSGDPSASFIKDTSNTDGLATEEDEGGVYCDEEGYVDSEDDEDWVLKSEMYLNNNTLDSDDDSDEDEGYNEPKQKWVGGDYIDSTKVVCSVENILKLMQRCQDCGEKLTQKVTNLIGGAVTVNFNCCNQHKGTWTSSPIIEPVSGRGRKATEIDLMFGTYIESSTMKVSEFHRMCDSVNLLHSTPANHYKRLADKAHRAIQESFQDSLNEAYTEMINHPSNSLTLCGDMRYDSRRKAKHGTYSIICQETEKVVANVVIHIDEANGQSGKLEEIGVLRALNSIPEEVLNKCGYFVTDENLGVIGVIADWNNARFLAGKRVIEHQLCSWHRNKNLMSKLKTFVSKTGGAILLDWSSSISRHWYHTLMTSKDNPSIIQEKLLSIPLHMQDIHTFPDNIEYKACTHGPVTDSKKYLPKGHAAIQYVYSTLRGHNNCRLRNLHMYSQNLMTTLCEVLNRVLNSFRPKDNHFSHKVMITGGMLGVVHWNGNSDRPSNSSVRLYRCKYTNKIRARNSKTPMQYSWQKTLIRAVVTRVRNQTTGEPIRNYRSVKRSHPDPELKIIMKEKLAKYTRK